MRSQCSMEVAVPIPVKVPAEFALEYLQTNSLALTQVCENPRYEEVSPDPVMLADDHVLGPWDKTARAFNIYGSIYLAPGLTKAATWFAIYQLIPTGVRLRATVNAGVISWTRWTIRRRVGGAPITDSESSSPIVETDEWELYGEVTIDANNLLMPFASMYLRRTLPQLGDRALDGLVQAYHTRTV
ncbi:hypothetical protein B0J13DRAFT_567250 [Dactylonectria estremocensis]|uniref:DUF7053 domain-containing protein n=1 Tax=Dactylonectria estremocensis TaxID=1079267 RepID=A0A9P9IIU5_9HYPO|nr:hypothetical protein B0J13DRAFT_567250 [Dactylonectria estremocensis]